MNNLKKVGLSSILSYGSIVLNTLSMLIIAPHIIDIVGDEQYGVYKLVTSVTTSLTVLDLGIGNTITRFIARYDAEGDSNKKDIVYTQSIKILMVLIPVILLVGICLRRPFVNFYTNSLTISGIKLAKTIYSIAVIEILVIVVESAYGGFLAGSNLYIYLNIVKIISIITRFLLTYICLYWCASAVLLIIIELITATIRLLMYIYILKMKTDICWERGCHNILMMKSLLSYTSIMFLDTIITIINNNSDNAIIGAICGAKEVAIYSFGIQIFSMFGMLSTSISMVMLPVMTKLVVNHVETHKLENCIIRAGKIQYILLGGMEFGFFILGKEFIMLWLGEDYLDVWIITFILMISSTIPLVENVTISILRAKNMMGIRVFLQFVEAVINIILTFALVKKFGYIVAAYTTAISSVAITTIILNIYYQIKLGLNMFRVLKSILFRTTITLIVGTILSYCIINSFLYDLTLTWFSFFIKGLIFLAIYSCGLLFFGISREERKYYLHQFRRK